MRLLLIEDHLPAQNMFEKRLREAGVVHEILGSSDPALASVIEASGADVVVLSLSEAFGTDRGLSLVKDLRSRGVTMGIVVLQSGLNSEEAVTLYNAGADDVAAKPIQVKLLVARCQALVRRSAGLTTSEITVGNLRYFLDGRPAVVKEQSLVLSKHERALLECLALRSGKIVMRDVIFTHLYGSASSSVDAKIIDVYVCKLRKKLRSAGADDYITTIFGNGYMLAAPAALTAQTSTETAAAA